MCNVCNGSNATTTTRTAKKDRPKIKASGLQMAFRFLTFEDTNNRQIFFGAMTRPAGTYAVRLATLGNYFDIQEGEGLISYLPKGRDAGDASPWHTSRRQSMKPGKFFRFLFPGMNDAKIERMAAKFKSRYGAPEIQKARTSDEINGVYSRHSGCFSSCMKYDPIGKFYAAAGAECWYINNEHGETAARAIFWPLATWQDIRNGITGAGFLDRVYYGDASHVEILQTAAIKAGAIIRNTGSSLDEFRHRGADGKDSIHYVEPSKVLIENKTPADLSGMSYYPYLDTLFSGSEDDRTLYWPDDCDTVFTYHETDGTRDGDNIHVCQHCGERHDDDERIYLERTGEDACQNCTAYTPYGRYDYELLDECHEVRLRVNGATIWTHIHRDDIN